jgi:hypothetical protein
LPFIKIPTIPGTATQEQQLLYRQADFSLAYAQLETERYVAPSAYTSSLFIADQDKTFITSTYNGCYEWDLVSGQLIHFYPEQYALYVSSDGQTLFTENETHNIIAWNRETKHQLYQFVD